MMIKEIINKYKGKLSILFSILMLIVIIQIIGLDNIIDALQKIEKKYLFFAFVLFMGSLIVAALRWDTIIEVTDFRSKYNKILQFLLIDKFANSFFPTSVVGMALRSVLLQKEYDVPKTVGLATIILDYGVDILGTFFLSLPFFYLIKSELPQTLGHTFQTSLITIGIAAIFVFLISSSETLLNLARKVKNIDIKGHKVIKKIAKSSISKKFFEFSVNFNLLIKNPKILINAMFLTFLKVMLDAIRISILFKAFGVSIPFYYFILFDSTWTFLAPLMFTPGGVGVIESGRIALYSLIPGTESTIITSVVFIDRLITYWFTVFLGAIIFFYTGVEIGSVKKSLGRKPKSA